MSVGVKASDDDHKKLVDLINLLHDGMREGHGKEVVGKVLNDLVSYTKVHFAREEEYFAKTGYPAAEHKREHQSLVKQAVDLQARYYAGDQALSVDTLTFLRDWLTNHIQVSDKAYSVYLNAHGVY